MNVNNFKIITKHYFLYQEEERLEQLDRRRRKHEELRRRMISKDSIVQETSSSSADSSDLEDLADELEDAESLNRSLEITDKYSECYVNINSSQPEKEKQSKEVYHLVDSGTTKVDTIDHNFVPYSEDTVDGVYAGSYPVEDENEPDIVKSTRTPPNTLLPVVQTSQSSNSVQETVTALPKLRIQTDILTKSPVDPSGLRVELPVTSTQQVPEAVVTPPSPTFQQPVAPPRRKKKIKMNSNRTTSQVEELAVS